MDTELVNWHNVAGALVFSGIGLVVFLAGFMLLNLVAPNKHIWREINEEQNVAVAIFVGSIIIGIAIIISSAVKG
jgi:uncharacterized membrane protein YjfL (UPF0719 family)